MTTWSRVTSFITTRLRPRSPVTTSLRAGVLFVLHSNHSPMTADGIAAETHADIDEVYVVLDRLLAEERITCAWDANSPFRVYSIIRKVPK